MTATARACDLRPVERKDVSDNATLHCWVSGRVQGVFFRQSTRDCAYGLALSGWVGNLPDGRVEAVFHGPRAACEQALVWIRQGPPSSIVSDVEHRWESELGDAGASFEIR